MLVFSENNLGVEDDNLNNSALHSSDASLDNKVEASSVPDIEDFSNWYTLRVVSGKEKFVKENILKELEFSEHLKPKITEIFVPFEKIVVIKNDKKKIKERMFFPGYILINMHMDNEIKYFIENSASVMSFVGPKGVTPAPLREKEVKRIFGEVKRKEGLVDSSAEVPFKKDDHVKVISGPFIDFNGVVEEVNKDKQKVRVIISIFGRPTPVELDFFQLEMVK
ncbi:MAG: transcription termination/antitermination factor NusG [Candidatus Marinimicrobia bacterium]|nr:transcription termination/antitermination factor NusG [Candidatus Neomarinimicrobiota bacterium]|tara:strand:- start:1111 stop:1779 length:669 start_codon:yes stop_codon:yes gene_type:complete